MHKIILPLSMVTGLIVGATGIAAASPATNLLGQGTPAAETGVEHIDYNWNHHHYHHRSWDKKNHHWHYYN